MGAPSGEKSKSHCSLFLLHITNHGTRRKPQDTLPLVGNGIVFLQARHKLFNWFSRCEQHFGLETFEISVPTLPPGIVINDPANLDYVFKNEAIFRKGDLFRRISWDLFGSGIINVDGDLWKAQRKAGLHFLSADNLKVLNNVALPRYLGDAIRKLELDAAESSDGEVWKGGKVVNLQEVFHEITSQIMGKMAYDMEMHSGDEFTAAFEHASGFTQERFQNPLWFVTEALTGTKFRQSLRSIQSVGQGIVEHALRKRHQQGIVNDKPQNAISGSLIYSLLDTLGEDKKLVADAALNYLSAGRDTVAQALTWTIYLLMKHDTATAQILEEVRQVRASVATDNIRPPAELFTPTSLPYTMAVFYEGLRLYPPIPFELKQSVREATLPDGTFLPSGTIVFWSPWAMNRSQAIWGPDVDSFRPERWLVQDEGSDDDTAAAPAATNAAPTRRRRLTLKTRPAAEFPVFNGGQRLCLGKKMAELMAAQIIPSLMEKFDFAPAFELTKERISGSSLTLPMEGGLPCYVRLKG
ncbi:cytochrome P450 [Microdochium bolleyi]|uniref:Cytochrome P450 n=1 Tax=Microdochium bolleyi TaxID=196109 RepID=A0A136IYM0_9PEZI|nr:cytochrome P450 [Microdochium bolleyi]